MTGRGDRPDIRPWVCDNLIQQSGIFDIESSWGTPHCPMISIYRSLTDLY